MTCVCEICGKQFHRKPSHVNRVVHQTCSRSCQTKLKHILAVETLEQRIGQNLQEWLHQKYITERMSSREISKLLYGTPTNSPNVLHYLHLFNMDVRKGSEAIQTQWEDAEDRKIKSSERAKTTLCSEENRDKLRIIMQTTSYRKRASEVKLGDKNPRWNTSMSDEERAHLYEERHSSKEATFRKWVFIRDKYTCQKCGSTTELRAHHVMSFKSNPELRFDVKNGITLCENCHTTFHQIYGYGNNTKEQFMTFME